MSFKISLLAKTLSLFLLIVSCNGPHGGAAAPDPAPQPAPGPVPQQGPQPGPVVTPKPDPEPGPVVTAKPFDSALVWHLTEVRIGGTQKTLQQVAKDLQQRMLTEHLPRGAARVLLAQSLSFVAVVDPCAVFSDRSVSSTRYCSEPTPALKPGQIVKLQDLLANGLNQLLLDPATTNGFKALDDQELSLDISLPDFFLPPA